MKEIIVWVNANSGFLSLIFSFMVATATVTYVIFTIKLANETRRLRKAQTEPLVSVTIEPLEPHINFMELRVQNVGLGPAYNLAFKITPDVSIGNELLNKRTPLNGLNYLRPGQAISSFLCRWNEFNPKEFTVRAMYKNSEGKLLEETFDINLNQYDGLHRLGKPTLVEIADNILEINKTLQKLTQLISKRQ
ncbi:MAG: hypothetical protein AB1488_06305 [Nitrospirota bacterium]